MANNIYHTKCIEQRSAPRDAYPSPYDRNDLFKYVQLLANKYPLKLAMAQLGAGSADHDDIAAAIVFSREGLIPYYEYGKHRRGFLKQKEQREGKGPRGLRRRLCKSGHVRAVRG